jgi:hypothetical protein
MDKVFKRIANMFWEDYVAEMEKPGGKIGSYVQVLTDFLVWIERRKARSPIIDLRLIKDPSASAAVDYIMEISDAEPK